MKNVKWLMPLLVISLFSPFSALAKKKPPALHGDVHLDIGKQKLDNAPAIVEYQGPCGAKKSLSVVDLWRKRVIGVTLWLSEKNGNADLNLPSEINIVGYKCEFSPRLVVARPGTLVKIINNDPYTQWLIVKEDGERKRQIKQEPEGKPLEITVQKGKNYHITSGFYPWMEVWIRSEDDVAAVTTTDSNGHFRFENLPGGDYTIHAWHPSLGETSEEVMTQDNKDQAVGLVYSMPEKVVPVIEASGLERILGTDRMKEKDDNPFKK